jgi:hypothetical protein
MADVQVKVDATSARLKLDRVPVGVRNQLRLVIPDLTRQVGSLVNSKLDSELKSRTHLQVTEELHDTTKGKIYGVVATVWNGASAQKLVPLYLEAGTRAHEIVAVNAGALAFFWERMGANVMFKRVMHPGFAGINYMARSFAEMKGEIVSKLQAAARAGARSA